jgi:sigma-B regulation protein RsbU (phosphoserine phosphatase)
MATAEYEPGETLLEPGELLVLYTDGFTEAFNAREEEFGQERLAQLCAGSAAKPLEEISNGIQEAVRAFTANAPPSDDRTLMLLRKSG